MKKFFYLMLLLLPLSIHAQKMGEGIDFSKYCGTWKYENADTTFVVSFKTAAENYIGNLNGDYLVGGYRLIVKDKFDDNYLMKFDEIPDEIYLKEDQQIDPSFNVYVMGSSPYGDSSGLIMYLYDQQTKSRNYGMRGMRIMILPDGTMKWWLDRKIASINQTFDYDLSVPTYAIMKKVE